MTDKTVLQCFPNKESILYNLDTALKLSLTEDRISNLCKCHSFLMEENYEKAVDFSKLAGYLCMSRAIEIHFVSNASKSV